MEIVFVDPDAITIGERIREDLGGLEGLKQSIAEVGLLHPIGVTRRLTLVYGARRLQAVKELGWQQIPCVYVDDAAAQVAELVENVKRSDLTWIEEVTAKAKLDCLYRQIHGSADRHSHPKARSDSDVGWSQAKTADVLGISRALLTEDIQLAKALEAYPELRRQATKSAAKNALRRKRLRPAFAPSLDEADVMAIRMKPSAVDLDLERTLGWMLNDRLKIALTRFCRERVVDYTVAIPRFVEDRLTALGFL